MDSQKATQQQPRPPIGLGRACGRISHPNPWEDPKNGTPPILESNTPNYGVDTFLGFSQGSRAVSEEIGGSSSINELWDGTALPKLRSCPGVEGRKLPKVLK